MRTSASETGAASSSTSSAVNASRGFLTCASSSRARRRRSMRSRRRRQKRRAFQTVRSVQSATRRTRRESGSLRKWMPTMSRPGRRVARQPSTTARCSARRTTARREIDNRKMIYTIDNDGTSAVEKFGYKLSRSRFSLTGTVSEKGGLE